MIGLNAQLNRSNSQGIRESRHIIDRDITLDHAHSPILRIGRCDRERRELRSQRIFKLLKGHSAVRMNIHEKSIRREIGNGAGRSIRGLFSGIAIKLRDGRCPATLRLCFQGEVAGHQFVQTVAEILRNVGRENRAGQKCKERSNRKRASNHRDMFFHFVNFSFFT